MKAMRVFKRKDFIKGGLMRKIIILLFIVLFFMGCGEPENRLSIISVVDFEYIEDLKTVHISRGFSRDDDWWVNVTVGIDGTSQGFSDHGDDVREVLIRVANRITKIQACIGRGN